MGSFIKSSIHRKWEERFICWCILNHWEFAFCLVNLLSIRFFWNFPFSEGFLIIHVQKQQCLSEKRGVIMEKCNMTSLSQKWQWMADDRLLHVKSAQCLSVSTLSALSSRSIIVDCPQAVRWNCHEDGLLKVANSSLFLTKQGQKVMAKRSKKYLHMWMQLKPSETGKPVYVNLCSKQGELFLQKNILGVLVTKMSLLANSCEKLYFIHTEECFSQLKSVLRTIKEQLKWVLSFSQLVEFLSHFIFSGCLSFCLLPISVSMCLYVISAHYYCVISFFRF